MNIPASMNEQIENAKALEISYRTLHEQAILKDKISGRNIQIPFASFTDKYKDFLNTIIVTVSLSDTVTIIVLRKSLYLSVKEANGICMFLPDILSFNIACSCRVLYDISNDLAFSICSFIEAGIFIKNHLPYS